MPRVHSSILRMGLAAAALLPACTPVEPPDGPGADQPEPAVLPAIRLPDAPRTRQPCTTDTACDDGMTCNGFEICVDGDCRAGIPVDCTDDDPCTLDRCAEQAGAALCIHDLRSCPAPLVCRPETGDCGCVEGAFCDDGDACTADDTCIAGSCLGGPRRDCDDGDPCTLDGCDARLGCIHQPIADCATDGPGDEPPDPEGDTPGDDLPGDGGGSGGGGGLECTPPGCNDGNPCTADTCVMGTCVHTPNAADCDDGNACTTGDRCVDGTCSPGSPTVCDDGNPCTTDSCDPQSGCQAVADDGNVCGPAFPCLEDAVCAGGSCIGTPLPDDTPCDDGQACTLADACSSGTCTGSPIPGCVACTDTGECDGDACTVGDGCVDGECASGNPRECDDGNPCTTDSCNPATGCIHSADVDGCDDGNDCTINDTCVLGACIGTVVPGCSAVPGVLFVKADAAGANDGSSWVDAFNELQSALDALTGAGGAYDEIWVAGGTYRPDFDVDTGLYTEARTATFALPATVTLRGGFGGFEDSTTRAIAAHPTILDGDLGIAGSADDNAFHVVTANAVDGMLEGFIITGGNATGHALASGGGLLITAGAPVISRCWLIDNRALNAGGLYAIDSAATLTGCRFLGNHGTAASANGGAVNIQSGAVTLSSCTFAGNTAAIGAGVVVGGMTRLTNCTFFANEATSFAGGAYVLASASAHLANCIFWNNTDTTGTGETAQITALGSDLQVEYSIIEGLTTLTGAGNAASDPLLRDPGGPDGVPGTADDDLRLSGGSPAIDAGINAEVDGTIDASGLGRMLDDPCTQDTGVGGPPVVDLGAHEAGSCPD